MYSMNQTLNWQNVTHLTTGLCILETNSLSWKIFDVTWYFIKTLTTELLIGMHCDNYIYTMAADVSLHR